MELKIPRDQTYTVQNPTFSYFYPAMLSNIIEYNKKEQLFKEGEKILLAVSGGVDSVCLCHLFAKADWPFGIAHCNFKLRGTASDEDASFVKELAEAFKVNWHSIEFDTAQHAESQKMSIQMAARDLRYTWLEAIRAKHEYHYIATAHHLNDSIETLIYNLSKGCGIRGLHGILPKNGRIIRPLLFAEKAKIERFAKEQNISYREDASNASDKYQRNYIRHHIIPAMQSLNPAFIQSSQKTLLHLRETEFLFHSAIEHFRSIAVKEEKDLVYINPEKLAPEAKNTILYELLRPMGFHSDQVSMLLNQTHQSGVYFSSATHTLLVDRGRYILKKMSQNVDATFLIHTDTHSIDFADHRISFEKIETSKLQFSQNPAIAILDWAKLQFPLILRPWRDGDLFQPFGMQGKHQKLQHFLTNHKLSLFDKAKIYVLESGDKICWVVGMRMDERFRIREQSEAALRIEIKEVSAPDNI